MKTKTIFKTLALFVMMPAMMLTTACSSDDDAIINNNETPAKKGYTLPVTINVTRQSEAATRATYTDNGDKTGSLSFSSGDQLFIYGEDDNAGQFAGTLTWVSGETFSGTITTENSYSGTANDLFSSAGSASSDYYLVVELLPNGYETYGFYSITEYNGYDDELSENYNKTFATTKALAVEQFSWEWTDEYDNGFALSPGNSILNFTISGLTASTEVNVALTGNGRNITGEVTTDGSGTATFAIGVPVGVRIEYYSLTVGGNAITLPEKLPEPGKIYNISRSVVPAGPTVDLSTLQAGDLTNGEYVVADGTTLSGTLAINAKISIAAGATVTLDNVSINANGSWTSGNYAGINCLGNATIILKDGMSNTVKGFCEDYPGIHVHSGYTLTIQGSGSLTASSNGYGAGIGGGYNISCGNITIQGGTIEATGGMNSAGIGGGYDANCGNITITTEVTSVTASCDGIILSDLIIGAGNGSGSCGTVTIGGKQYYDGTTYLNNGYAYLSQNPLVYSPSATGESIVTWGTSELSQITIQGNLGSRTINGIVLALGNPNPLVVTNTDDYVYWDSGNNYLKVKATSNNVKFTAPSGKKFTKIEITIADGNHISHTGWTNDVWTGSSSTVTVSGMFNVTSIEFTLEDV